MGEETNIEWATSTFNPFIGCTRVSPACANCYAATYGNRFGVEWGPGKPRRRTSEANWRKPVAWNAKAKRARQRWAQLGAVGPAPARPRVFCASLADWLDDEVPIEWLADLLTLVEATPELDWLLLTKRPQLWRSRVEAAKRSIVEQAERFMPRVNGFLERWLAGERPDNVWLGVTVEDQRRADERIPELLAIPARVRFLSCEPLLGPVDLTVDETVTFCNGCARYFRTGPDACPVCGTSSLSGRERSYLESAALHWIIAGGESGDGARPSHPAWFRSLLDQAAAFDVPFLFKQHGEWAPAGDREELVSRLVLTKERDIDALEALWISPDGVMTDRASISRTADDAVVYRFGKKAAGRLLDGRLWDELPRVRA